MIKHIFIDFDETLFNHYKYLDWVDGEVTARHNLKKGSFAEKADDYHDHMGPKLRLYRHEDHIRALTGRDWATESTDLVRRRRELDLDFCYEDTHEFLEAVTELADDVRLLTYGDPVYQNHKIASCRILERLALPVTIVKEAKADYLARIYGGESGILIDDKYPLNLPPGWHHLWINRLEPLDEPRHLKQGITQAYTLRQVREFLAGTS